MKRALVLSGGGAKGAFQVGALKYLIGDLELQYSAITGISVGALNAGFLAMYKVGDEKDALADLEDMWLSLSGDRDIYRNWRPFGVLMAPWKESIYNSEPLWKLVARRFSVERVKASGKQIRVGAVSLATGQYAEWTETDDDLDLGILASSAFPLFFRPIKARGAYWTDGGIREITPISSALGLGADAVDAILTTPTDSSPGSLLAPRSYRTAKQVIDIMSNEVMRDDLRIAELLNNMASCEPSVRAPVRICAPEVELMANSLDFSPAKIRENMQKGYAAAKQAFTA